MDENALGITLYQDYKELLEMDPFPGDQWFLDKMTSRIDEEFQKAIPTSTNVDITTPAGSLRFIASTDMVIEIAYKCASYWENTIDATGTPVSCATIVSVSNNASSIASIIRTGLLSLAAKQLVEADYYKEFCKVIFDAVRTIVWDVSEADPSGCSSSFTVTVS